MEKCKMRTKLGCALNWNLYGMTLIDMFGKQGNAQKSREIEN